MFQYLTSCLLLYRHNKIKWTFLSLHITNLQWLKEKFISTIWQIFSLLWDQCSQCALLRNCTYTGMNTQQFFCIRCDKKELFVPTLNRIPISNLHGSATPVILFLKLNNQLEHMQINNILRCINENYPSKCFTAAKHPKHNKIRVTKPKKKTSRLFYGTCIYFISGNSLTNLGFFAKVSFSV